MIDDSESMKEHWDDVMELAKLLAYITKVADPDGLELYFLSDLKVHTTSKASRVSELVRNHRCKNDTSLETVFAQALRDFAKNVGNVQIYNQKHRLRSKNDPRSRSLYVLTDGKLALGERDQGRDAIRFLAKSLKEAGHSRDKFGIQFIRFGSDLDGRRLTEGLDELADRGEADL